MADLLSQLQECHCLRCLHRWVTRKAGRPLKCPHCGSPYWDRLRIRDSKIAKEERSE